MTITVSIRDPTFSEDGWTATIAIEAVDGNRIGPERFAVAEGGKESDLLDRVKVAWESVPEMTAWAVPAKHKSAPIKAAK